MRILLRSWLRNCSESLWCRSIEQCHDGVLIVATCLLWHHLLLTKLLLRLLLVLTLLWRLALLLLELRLLLLLELRSLHLSLCLLLRLCLVLRLSILEVRELTRRLRILRPTKLRLLLLLERLLLEGIVLLRLTLRSCSEEVLWLELLLLCQLLTRRGLSWRYAERIQARR